MLLLVNIHIFSEERENVVWVYITKSNTDKMIDELKCLTFSAFPKPSAFHFNLPMQQSGRKYFCCILCQ